MLYININVFPRGGCFKKGEHHSTDSTLRKLRNPNSLQLAAATNCLVSIKNGFESNACH